MASVEENVLNAILNQQGPVRGSRLNDMRHRKGYLDEYPAELLNQFRRMNPDIREGTDSWYEGLEALSEETGIPTGDSLREFREAGLPIGTVEKSSQISQPHHSVQGARRGPSVHSTNAEERATTRQRLQNSEPNEYGDIEGPISVKEQPTDSMISDHMWKIIQEVDPKDGEKFYQLPGKEALQTLGMSIKGNSDLADFWDRSSEEDRYYIIRALDAAIGGAASDDDLIDDAQKQKAEDEQSVIDMMMDMNK